MLIPSKRTIIIPLYSLHTFIKITHFPEPKGLPKKGAALEFRSSFLCRLEWETAEFSVCCRLNWNLLTYVVLVEADEENLVSVSSVSRKGGALKPSFR